MWFRSSLESPKPKSTRCRYLRRSIDIEPLEDRRLLSFSPSGEYPVGNNPVALVTADFNSDGLPDLAAPNSGNGTVSVMLGNADGTFQPAQNTVQGAGPQSVAVGDFNADGKLDLVTTSGTELSVLLGNGDGTFQAPANIDLGSVSQSVAVGDFNGDGKLDLGVTSNVYYPGGWGYGGQYPGYNVGRANVLLGNGAGAFSAPSITPLEYVSLATTVLADFNGDNKLDLATTSYNVANPYNPANVVVLLGTGTGSLGTPNSYSLAYYSQSMTAGDVNGDGKVDLVTGGQTATNNVGVLLGTGDGTFLDSQYYMAGGYSSSLALGDFNGDGTVDLLTANWVGNTVTVLLGAGAGTFQAPVSISVGTSPLGLAVGDFNGDERDDAATANFGSNSVSVLLNNGIWPAAGMPSISISDVPTIVEGNTGTVAAIFTVSLSGAYSQTTSVQYATADGAATVASGDYQAKSGTLTFSPGQTSQTITVLVSGDRVAESNETFSVNLTNPINAFLTDATGVGTILDDEPIVSVVDFASGLEGNIGTTPMTFTVTLSAPYDVPVSVDYSASNLVDDWLYYGYASAIADVDFEAHSGTLTFAPGETSKSITVLVNGDRIAGEYSEYFLVTLSSPTGAGLGRSQGLGEIQDDEPYLSIEQASVAEGNTGTKPLVFTATLSAAYDAPVTVSYATFDGSASAGSDFTALSGTLTFAPGETSKTVSVQVKGDTQFEGDEYFYLNLIEASSATITDGSGFGIIVDDDAPQISVSDASTSEGQSGTKPLVFTVSLSSAATGPVRVNYATANGTATANGDYQSTSGTITFAPGQTSKTVTVQIKGDRTTESDETFTVNLSNVTGGTIEDGQGVGTIINDDTPRLRVNDVTKKEGSSGTTKFVFTVSLSSAADSRVTVDYATADGSAKKSDGDYSAQSGKLTFSPGQTSKTVTVLVQGDKKIETNESFYLNLGNAKGADIDDGQGMATIVNDDAIRRADLWYAFAWQKIDDAINGFLASGIRKQRR